MRRLVTSIIAITLLGISPAVAHQPVTLLGSDTTAAKGPLLTDGTVSFAVTASFTKAGQKKAFRAEFKEGDNLTLQYLIRDQKPESAIKTQLQPQVTVVAPSGAKFTLKINERTKFFEPFSKTNYLYLSRYTATAEAGTYSVTISSRAKSSIVIAIGDREVPGEVVRGSAPAPQTPASTSATPTPTKSPTPSPSKAGYTMADVKAHNTPSKCWTAVEGSVYDLTTWIAAHPGGSSPIKSLCGTDGTAAFKSMHGSQSKPNQRLDSFLLGPLSK